MMPPVASAAKVRRFHKTRLCDHLLLNASKECIRTEAMTIAVLRLRCVPLRYASSCIWKDVDANRVASIVSIENAPGHRLVHDDFQVEVIDRCTDRETIHIVVQ